MSNNYSSYFNGIDFAFIPSNTELPCFIWLSIFGSVYVTHIDRGYDHHLEGELFM